MNNLPNYPLGMTAHDIPGWDGDDDGSADPVECDTEGCDNAEHEDSEHRFCATCELAGWQYELAHRSRPEYGGDDEDIAECHREIEAWKFRCEEKGR